MLGWLWRWRRSAMERAIARLAAENRAMKSQWRAEHGDEPFPLTPEEGRKLKEKRDQLSPDRRQQLDPDDVFGVENDAG